ncbi:serine acetyltransferase [bacterium]|nr:serine acetyltransferase [bacterium]
MNAEMNPDALVDGLVASYAELGGINHIDGLNLPNRQEIIEITHELLALIFPGYLDNERLTSANVKHVTGYRLARLFDRIAEQVERGLVYECKRAESCDYCQCRENGRTCARLLFEQLPELRRALRTDVEAAFRGDPACYSHDEAILCYPGVLAIAIQRIAHVLYEYHIPFIPRIMTEYAHRMTGIDIHPGAKIGEYFFIDHGTGVVIGETTVIGRNVKLYQGVTLGAKSFPKNARDIRGHKRHPTIEDDAVIYAGATILGDIIIGAGSVIGGNTWITESTAPGTTIIIEPPKMRVKSKSVARTAAQQI